jgi:signal transduction histidine kinase
MNSSPDHNGGVNNSETRKPEAVRHISPTVAAHELNNALTIVQGYAEHLAFKHQKDPALAKDLKLISDAANRASALVQSVLKQSASPPSPQISPTSRSIR